jgi:hypothetical protein
LEAIGDTIKLKTNLMRLDPSKIDVASLVKNDEKFKQKTPKMLPGVDLHNHHNSGQNFVNNHHNTDVRPREVPDSKI